MSESRLESRLESVENKLDQLMAMMQSVQEPRRRLPSILESGLAPAVAPAVAPAAAASLSSFATIGGGGSSSQLSPGRCGSSASRARRRKAASAAVSAGENSDEGGNAFSAMMTGGRPALSTLKDKTITEFVFECVTQHGMALPTMANARHKSQAKPCLSLMMAMFTEDEKEDLLPVSLLSDPDRRTLIRRVEILLLTRLGEYYEQANKPIPRPIVLTAKKEASASSIATVLLAISKFKPTMVVDLGDFGSWRSKRETREEEEEQEVQHSGRRRRRPVVSSGSDDEEVSKTKRRKRPKKSMTKAEILSKMRLDDLERRRSRHLARPVATGAMGAVRRMDGLKSSLGLSAEGDGEEEFEVE